MHVQCKVIIHSLVVVLVAGFVLTLSSRSFNLVFLFISSDILSIHGLTVRMNIDVVRKDVELSFLCIMSEVCLLFGFFSSGFFLPKKVFIRGFSAGQAGHMS